MKDRCLVCRDQMIIEEKEIPEPQPEDLLFLLRRLLIGAHIIEVAGIEHRSPTNIELVLRTAKIFTYLVQEMVQLNVQLLHLRPFILLKILERQSLFLLPLNGLRQPKASRDIELRQICIKLPHVKVIFSGILQIS